MSSLSEMIDQIRGIRPESVLGLRPMYPRVALEFGRNEIVLVRIKRQRRGRPVLQVHRTREFPDAAVPGTIYDQYAVSPTDLGEALRGLFESAGIRPGRVSIVLPDNLAKISLLTLPERPPSRKHLDEVIRFKMRRAVPFRLSDSILSYQLLPGEGNEALVLVAAIRRNLVEQYEQAFDSIGARPGLVDLCTPNLLNLCRNQIKAAEKRGGDVALLNSASNYFSLVIVRRSRLIFFRCKTYTMGGEDPSTVNGLLSREVASSFSYYEEKLQGQRIGTLLVRDVHAPFEEVVQRLGDPGVEHVERLDPGKTIELEGGKPLDEAVAQRLASVVGAATGRG